MKAENTQFMLLAPIIKDSKGKQSKIVENLVTQGYIRARIDGCTIC